MCIHPYRDPTRGVSITEGSYQRCAPPYPIRAVPGGRTKGVSIPIGILPELCPSLWGAHLRCSHPELHPAGDVPTKGVPTKDVSGLHGALPKV